MRFTNLIKEALTITSLLCCGMVMAVQLPSTSYVGPEYSEYDYSSSVVSGPSFPSRAFIALGAGADDCTIVEGNPDACKTCCENAYGNCSDECDDPNSDECKECQAKISSCKKDKCEKSLPLDGGEWMLITLLAMAVIGRIAGPLIKNNQRLAENV